MRTSGLPNDIFQNISALTVIISMPLIQQLIYSVLRHLKISYPPINRITVGFFLQAAAMAYASGVQKIIYSAGPCYEKPLKCPLSADGAIPNSVSVALQVPAYVLDGLVGALYYPAGQEYAYTKAPNSMRSLVQAILMLTVALGAAFAIALSPLYMDPTNMILYASLAGLMAFSGCLFIFPFGKYNRKEDDMNRQVRNQSHSPRELKLKPASTCNAMRTTPRSTHLAIIRREMAKSTVVRIGPSCVISQRGIQLATGIR